MFSLSWSSGYIGKDVKGTGSLEREQLNSKTESDWVLAHPLLFIGSRPLLLHPFDLGRDLSSLTPCV